ncbi:MAG: hypothetical protein J0M33_19765 [Anaerolineae bacterium]|nr:hypothetical protein [Anaerolineae bacterium]
MKSALVVTIFLLGIFALLLVVGISTTSPLAIGASFLCAMPLSMLAVGFTLGRTTVSYKLVSVDKVPVQGPRRAKLQADQVVG